VIVRPEPRIKLRDDDLLVGSPDLVDFFRQQRCGIEAVSADFNFLRRIARDQLIRVDSLFETGE